MAEFRHDCRFCEGLSVFHNAILGELFGVKEGIDYLDVNCEIFCGLFYLTVVCASDLLLTKLFSNQIHAMTAVYNIVESGTMLQV